MTEPKKKRAGRPAGPIVVPYKRAGNLSCSRCSITLAWSSFGEGETRDGGWPQHRCGFEVRSFTTWTPIHLDPVEDVPTPPEQSEPSPGS